MDKQFILFDLDGVISDPKEGITKSIDYALRFFGIVTEDIDSLKRFIGPPLFDSFMEYYGFSSGKAEEAMKQYRIYFKENGIFENYMYEGMADLLRKLYHAGKKLILATSKPTEFSRQIIERYGVLNYFADICGSTMDNSRTSKGDVIRYALERNEIRDPSQAIMVGDRKFDIVGAHENQVDCIAVTYGYGSLEEIYVCSPEWIARDILELEKVLLN
jgi:phosphoglycolate phosphatase